MRKFLIDVNVPKDLWLLLKEEGFAFHCLHDIDREMPDREVVKLALKKGYIVVTCDKDFSVLQKLFPKLEVIIFQAKTQEIKDKKRIFLQVLKLLKKNPRLQFECTILKC